MANILIAEPLPIASISASRGSGIDNLLSFDPREIWMDDAVGSAATIDIDLGGEQIVNMVCLAALFFADTEATWEISGGLEGPSQIIMPSQTLRVPERDWRVRTMSHSLWLGPEQLVRHLRIRITQPSTAQPLAIGALAIANGFQPEMNKEWGAGRGVKDTSTVTRLASGGVAVVEGARYGTYNWTLGDLSEEETDKLYELQLGVGESRPIVVVEDPAMTAGLRNRIHYGGLVQLRAFERRNQQQTRWQMNVEDWAVEPDPVATATTIPALTLGGEPLTFGGEILTIGT